MPSAQQFRKRGGLVRVRTMEGPHPGQYVHVYVVRKAGPRGGHTIAGETKTRKG